MATQESMSEKATETARTKAEEAREKAEKVGGRARDAAQQAGTKAQEKISQAADQAKDIAEEFSQRATAYASEAVGGARAAVDEEIRHEQERAEGFLHALSDAIDAGCERLREDGYRSTASLIRPASRAVRSFANEVNTINPQDYTRRAENFVRDNPMLAMGALAIAGFAVGALLQRNR